MGSKLRFNLRSILFLFVCFSVFLGVNHNRRMRIQTTLREIQKVGGEVFYVWQDPRVKSTKDWIPNYYVTTRHNGGYFVDSYLIETIGTQHQGSRLRSLLLGNNDDIIVKMVAISANSVDENFVDWLEILGTLELILVFGNQDYFSVKASDRFPAEFRKQDLSKLGEELHLAKELISKSLPSVEIRVTPERK